MAKTATSSGTTAKHCNCRDPKTNKQLGAKCPKLKRADGRWSSSHGAWKYQFELPPHKDGTRRNPLRRYGFATEAEASDEIDRIRRCVAIAGAKPHLQARAADLIIAAIKRTRQIPEPETLRARLHAVGDADTITTFGELLDEFLRRARQRELAPGTLTTYEAHVRLYLKPYLGHIPYDEVSVADFGGMFDWIEEFNQTLAAMHASKDQAVRASVRWRRPVGPTTKHRIRSTARAAFNMYLREQRLTFNPAAWIQLPPKSDVSAQVWTESRVEAWRRDCNATMAVAKPYPGRRRVNVLEVYIGCPRPSPVMVWTPAQAATFLDHARSHPLYAAYRLITLRGLRRGEAVGLRHIDVHLDRRLVDIAWQITQVGWEPIAKPPKSTASKRTVGIDPDTTTALAVTTIAQGHAAAEADDWTDTGYFFTDAHGQPFHPQYFTDEFYRLAYEARLPPIQLHGLRHTAACLMHAAGADIKEIQETLGHSSQVLTGDIYTTVFHETSHATAQATADLIAAARLKER